jgi:hypothetical protein
MYVQKASLGARNEYEVIGRANPGEQLDVLEEDKIREKGVQKEGGEYVNKRHRMSAERYRAAGGRKDMP